MSRSWQDSSRPRDERLCDLPAEMTLEEKVAASGIRYPCRDVADRAGDLQFPKPGSYSSADASMTLSIPNSIPLPLATSTLPLGSNVAV